MLNATFLSLPVAASSLAPTDGTLVFDRVILLKIFGTYKRKHFETIVNVTFRDMIKEVIGIGTATALEVKSGVEQISDRGNSVRPENIHGVSRKLEVTDIEDGFIS